MSAQGRRCCELINTSWADKSINTKQIQRQEQSTHTNTQKMQRHSRERRKDLIWTKRQLGYCIVLIIGYWLRGTRAKVKSRVIRQFKKQVLKTREIQKSASFETHGNTLYRKNCSAPKKSISTLTFKQFEDWQSFFL